MLTIWFEIWASWVETSLGMDEMSSGWVIAVYCVDALDV